MTYTKKPELLAPAGDLEKLKVAILYGADAVYLGSSALSLRARAKNFDSEQMAEGISFAHEHGAKVYVAANILAHNTDFSQMADYFQELEALGADALIISDAGVFSVAKRAVPKMDLHVSTQANVTNKFSAQLWKDLGASRVILARELSLEEIREISDFTAPLELEVFAHGAMCVSYSGRCLLSNYMANRDANRGDCVGACRFRYHLVEEQRPGQYMPITQNERGTFIFNSKDMCMIEHMPDLLSLGLSGLKIEGRMKTPYYVGTVTRAYRQAIDECFADEKLYLSRLNHYIESIKKASYRDFTTGFYYGKPDDAQNYENSSYIRTTDFVGMVKSYDESTGYAIIEQRNKFTKGDTLHVLTHDGDDFCFTVTDIINPYGLSVIDAPHPQEILKLRVSKPLKPYEMLYKS